ncbi:hypothetical protein [Schaalia vaccimaxillae]|uniref:hypothetical protein n=1 Tax=Schaalia vaccimaxillae TaxID=183916 RepID=UPI0003B406C2|nr:hypothetical protein [Schaalia vaccimaxillae]
MFPWSEKVWKPSDKAFKAARKGRVHAVTVRVESVPVLDQAWQSLGEKLSREDEFLLDGGSSLCRLNSREVEIVSGGEDMLDSLSWTVNVTFAQAVSELDPSATIAVASEGKNSVS